MSRKGFTLPDVENDERDDPDFDQNGDQPEPEVEPEPEETAS